MSAYGLRPAESQTGASSGAERCLRLSALEIGARARLCEHSDRPPAPPRLLDLGFVPGTPLRLLRRAPFGGPVEVELRGYRLCIRTDDLDEICVTPWAADAGR